MNNRIDILKGIHPGKLIESELKERAITQRALAAETNIPYQTINAIIRGERNLTTEQALRIEGFLQYEEGLLLILQSFHQIKLYKDKELAQLYPEPPNIRKSLFWDADFDKINWGKHKKAVIERILERGSSEEIAEIKRYYGVSKVEIKEFIPTRIRQIRNRHLTNR